MKWLHSLLVGMMTLWTVLAWLCLVLGLGDLLELSKTRKTKTTPTIEQGKRLIIDETTVYTLKGAYRDS